MTFFVACKLLRTGALLGFGQKEMASVKANVQRAQRTEREVGPLSFALDGHFFLSQPQKGACLEANFLVVKRLKEYLYLSFNINIGDKNYQTLE